jgi:enterobactin synthetase component D
MPVWPEAFVGSITHTDGWASAAVAAAGTLLGLGIDSERILAEEKALKLGGRYASEGERLMQVAMGEQPGLFFTLLFSGKESLYKAVFPSSGIHFAFEDTELVSLDFDSRTFRLRCKRAIGLGLSSGKEVLGRFETGPDIVHTAIEFVA